MHQLKGLIWKAYKARLRSPLSSSLDIAGPIVIIIVYLCFKLLLSSLPVTVDPGSQSINLFRNQESIPLSNPRTDLKRHLCTKVLFNSVSSSSLNNLTKVISDKCGLELIQVDSRDQVISKLRDSLDARISLQAPGLDLNWPNSTTNGCFNLVNNSTDTSYQAGLVVNEGIPLIFDIYLTDTADSSIIQQPFSLGSSYNEYRLPTSDLNSGLHLLQICLSQVVDQLGRTGTSNPQVIGNGTFNDISAVKPSMKLRISAFPLITASNIVPMIYLIFQMASNFCNALATVTRVSEDNESGIHQYARFSGTPASVYWLGQIAINSIHMALQSLLTAILLAIPTSSVLFDPMHDTNITFRFALLFTYSMSIQTHAMLIGSFFDRSSHAILITCLLAVSYAVFPLIFMLQWSPFGFTPFGFIRILAMMNPVSNFEALIMVINGVCLQKSQSPNWSFMPHKILGGGISEYSVGQLMSLLVAQVFIWFVVTVICDKFYYDPTLNPFRFMLAIVNDLCCCHRLPLLPSANDAKLTLKSVIKSSASKQQTLDPNRLCCSIRNFTVHGSSIMMAQTKGNPLRWSPEKLSRLAKTDKTYKMQHYIVNRSRSSLGQQKALDKSDGPTIREAIEQHIVWTSTNMVLNNLNLDFRFNQVSFVLGQTDLKDLLFNAILGLCSVQSGHMILDGKFYTPANLSLARPHIGYLGERDVFLNDMTIFENLQFFGSLRNPSYRHYDSESQFLLSLLHLTKRRNNLPVVQTSRSARKLALAVASVGHTKLLLLVEPTLSLRWRPRCHVLNLLKKYKSIRSIVVDTSDIDEAVAFGDKIVLLKDGRADLDGSPGSLRKKLACGHWLLFEPISDSAKMQMANNHLNALDSLTNEIFQDDKLCKLELTTKSVYHELIQSRLGSETSLEPGHKRKSPDIVDSKLNSDAKASRGIAILKVQSSNKSNMALCSLLKRFSSRQNVNGFRLIQLNYESLEDVIVLRMSKAAYPDLPPELLLALSQRTQSQRGDRDKPQISVRKLSSDLKIPKVIEPMFGAKTLAILKDRLYNTRELANLLVIYAIALSIISLAMWGLQNSLVPEPVNERSKFDKNQPYFMQSGLMEHATIEKLYEKRIGFYVIGKEANLSDGSIAKYFQRWKLNPKLTGTIDPDSSESDALVVAKIIQSSRDLLISLIIYNPKNGEATIAFEPYLTHAMIAGLKSYINFQLSFLSPSSNRSLDSPTDQVDNSQSEDVWPNRLLTNHHHFSQDWHEIVLGQLNRRLYYGLGFALAEGIVTGALVMAPMRHKSESREINVKYGYWLAMALFDMSVSTLLIIGYTSIVALFENTYSFYLISCMILVLILYKLASLPIAYLVSMIVESRRNGFLFLVLIHVIYSWVFSINLKAFVEWTLYGQSYVYVVANWIFHIFPVSSLINSLTDINHMNRINVLCKKVPAFMATDNLVPIEGVQKSNVVDKLLFKVNECLANGKSGVDIGVLHQQTLGIFWNICLLLLFGIMVWIFLLFSERVFGLITRRFSSERPVNDPMKAIIRHSDTLTNGFKWDRERDRLINEYFRCMNETKYIQVMSANCLYLRIWMRPMSDQKIVDRHMNMMIEPIVNLGQLKSDIQIELKTTLQLFIRIGNERKPCKLSKIQLIEAYSKFVQDHSDTIINFAVLDWTRQTLYKILLHGHYNTRSISAVT